MFKICKVKKMMKCFKEKLKFLEDLVWFKLVFFCRLGNELVVGLGIYGKVFKGVNVYIKKFVVFKWICMEGECDGFFVMVV